MNMQKIKSALLDRSSKKGISGTVIASGVGAITLFIIILVISNVQTSVSQTGWTAQANTTYANVQTTVWNALNLQSVGLIVMAAVSILGMFYVGTRGGK